jgi:hypothetical protein
MSIKFAENPGLTHLKTILNRPIRSRENTTPVLENRHYFTVVVYHRTEAIGPVSSHEATAIEFSSSMPRMVEKVGKGNTRLTDQFRQEHDPGPFIITLK